MATESQRRRTALAGTTVGLGVAGGSGLVRSKVSHKVVEATGKPKPHPLLGGAMRATLHHGTGRQRALYGAAMVGGILGATGTAVGVNELTRRRRPEDAFAKAGFIATGLQSNVDALRRKQKNISSNMHEDPDTKKTLARVSGVGVATGTVGGIAAAEGAHKLVDRAERAKGLPLHSRRALATASVGALGGAVTGRVLSHQIERKFPGYEVTPTGVKRKKVAAVRPSTTTKQVDQRNGKRAFRQAVVGKADELPKRRRLQDSRGKFSRDSTVAKLDSSSSNRSRRAAITSAGSVPFAGDFMSAATAGHLAPKGQQHKAAATQFSGNVSAYPGALAGAVVANRALSKDKAERLNSRIEGAKAGARRTIGLKPKVDKAPRQATTRAGRAVLHLAKPLRTPAGKVGALAGGALLGQAGAQTATTVNFRREKVAKLAPGAAMPTKREQRDTLKHKRRTLAAGAFASGTGLTSVGLLGASLATHKPKLRAQLKDASYASGIVGGAVAGAQGLRNASLIRRDLKRQDAVLHKSLTMPTKQAVMRASSLATRRTRSGMLVTTRRAGGVVR